MELENAENAFQEIISIDPTTECVRASHPKYRYSGSGSGGGYMQNGGKMDIERLANYAIKQFKEVRESSHDEEPSPVNEYSIFVFCKLIIFIEILSILKDFINKEMKEGVSPEHYIPPIIRYIIDCINIHLTSASVILAYFRSIFGGTLQEQTATAVCAGLAGYSATYLPLFINLLFNFIHTGCTNVKYAIDFVGAYMPVPVAAVVSNYASFSGIIAIGFILYGIGKNSSRMEHDARIISSLKSITQKDTLYHSVLNFFLDMSPVRAGMRIPSNVKAWFVYLKDKIRPDPDKTTHMIMNTFIKANDINSEQLIKFSGSLKTIMTCIFEQIETENPGDVDKLHSFFTSYYTGIDKKFDSRLESVKDGLKEHALSLFEKTQPSTQPSKKGRIGVGGGGDGSKRKRNRNIKVTIKHKRINKKQSIKNKNFTRK
jgi:hypothetical protein